MIVLAASAAPVGRRVWRTGPAAAAIVRPNCQVATNWTPALGRGQWAENGGRRRWCLGALAIHRRQLLLARSAIWPTDRPTAHCCYLRTDCCAIELIKHNPAFRITHCPTRGYVLLNKTLSRRQTERTNTPNDIISPQPQAYSETDAFSWYSACPGDWVFIASSQPIAILMSTGLRHRISHFSQSIWVIIINSFVTVIILCIYFYLTPGDTWNYCLLSIPQTLQHASSATSVCMNAQREVYRTEFEQMKRNWSYEQQWKSWIEMVPRAEADLSTTFCAANDIKSLWNCTLMYSELRLSGLWMNEWMNEWMDRYDAYPSNGHVSNILVVNGNHTNRHYETALLSVIRICVVKLSLHLNSLPHKNKVKI